MGKLSYSVLTLRDLLLFEGRTLRIGPRYRLLQLNYSSDALSICWAGASASALGIGSRYASSQLTYFLCVCMGFCCLERLLTLRVGSRCGLLQLTLNLWVLHGHAGLRRSDARPLILKPVRQVLRRGPQLRRLSRGRRRAVLPTWREQLPPGLVGLQGSARGNCRIRMAAMRRSLSSKRLPPGHRTGSDRRRARIRTVWPADRAPTHCDWVSDCSVAVVNDKDTGTITLERRRDL